MPRAPKANVKVDPEAKSDNGGAGGLMPGRWSYEEKLAVLREVLEANIGKTDFKEIHRKLYIEGNRDHAFEDRSVKQGKYESNFKPAMADSPLVRDMYK